MEKQARKGRKTVDGGDLKNQPVYVSEFSEQQLKGIQLKRVLLTAAAAVCLAVAAFLPANLDEFYSSHRILSGIYAAVVLFAGIAGLYVLYQAQRRHKLRVRIPKSDAPPKGFSKRTYLSVEIFTALIYIVMIMQSALFAVSADIYMIIAMILMVVAVFCGSVAWMVLRVTNKNSVLEGDDKKDGGDNVPAELSADTQKAESGETPAAQEQVSDSSDDFYNTQS